MRRKRILPQNRPAAGGEAREGASFFISPYRRLSTPGSHMDRAGINVTSSSPATIATK